MAGRLAGGAYVQGTLDDFDLRFIFRFLSASLQTGKLTVMGPLARGTVFFRRGEVYHAESDLRREGFGRKLVRAGKISDGQLRSTLERSAASGRGLGEALVEAGLIERADLERALCEEIQEVALGLFANASGRFEFTPGEEVESDTLILVPVESLIDEDSQAFKQRVPVLSPLTRSARRGHINISPEEWSVIASIDGRRTVAEVAARSRMTDWAVLRTLRRLRSQGLVTLPGEGRDGLLPEPEPGSHQRASGSARSPRAQRPPPPPPPPRALDLTEPATARAVRPRLDVAPPRPSAP